ncbi:hypothetical protein F7Q99_31690 [Streptomyces kaniharaensis]|uniref:Uncharacterized protein n=1 Tax=Streptomyces kaniharaensis TaxID=212423 RepID=A0A6N7L290_9ACTN|nr:hypothetical protein [Streptomyces kaniharaensis]MQS16628.1 hypothetical protein [Streptomyces kaniharaensis]
MKLRFLAVDLPPIDQLAGHRRAQAIYYAATYNLDEYPTFEALAEEGLVLQCFEVRDQDGHVLAEWWQFYRGDSGVLFRAGTLDPIGEALQHGFVCRDHELWAALAEVDDAPGFIDWSITPEDDRGSDWDRLWHHTDPAEAERLYDLNGRVFTRG